jgi:hypothetical protein
VRATAAVGLVAGGWGGEEARAVLDALVAEGGEETSLGLARAIAAQPAEVFEEALLRLSEAESDRVLVEVARAMRAMGRPRFLPALLSFLGRREVRADARAAFLARGDEGLGFLDEALGDHGLPLELRRHVPRTVALFEPVRAAEVLARHVLGERSGAVRYRILRGMNRLASWPEVRFDPVLLRSGTDATLAGVFRLVHWRSVLERGAKRRLGRATPGHDLLVQILRDKEEQAIERLFRLLALRHREEDFKGIYRGLHSSDSRARESSRELLENVLEPARRGPVLAVVDEGGDLERLARAGEVYALQPLGYEDVLGLILDGGGESLRCVAAHHVGELGLVELRPRLEKLRGSGTSFFLSRVVENALAAFPQEGARRA